MKKINNIMIYMQMIMMFVLLAFLIASAFKPWLIKVTEILTGVTLLIIAYNNHKIMKRKNMTIIYLLFGILMIAFGVVDLVNG